jgi:hypothetical protein
MSNTTIQITRIRDNGAQTLGIGQAKNGGGSMRFVTLEPSWLLNQPHVSCIDVGCYHTVKRTSSREGDHFHLKHVTGRSYILIHAGNYRKNTEGCILVGSHFQLLNNDEYVDVVNSKRTLTDLRSLMPESFSTDIMRHGEFQRFYKINEEIQ